MNDIIQKIIDMSLLDIYRERATKAWDKFDRLHDGWLGQMANRDLEVTISTIDSFEAMAIGFQKEYFQLYYKLNSDQCTCKPNDATACDVCKAQIKAKSTYREEM